MHIFITGGSGFIGKALVRELTLAGHGLTMLVRPSSDLRGLPAGIDYVQKSLFDDEGLAQAMSSCECLIHLANLYSFWEKDTALYQRINVEGTRCVYQAALQAGVKKVLHISSAVVWGDAEEVPYTESSPWGQQTLSAYAESKRQADEMAWKDFYPRGLPLVGVYPASVIGPGDNKSSGQMALDIIKRRLPATALHDSRITFVDVRDVAKALALLVERQDVIGERFLLGKESIRLGDYMRIVSQTAGVPLPIIPLPVWAVWMISWWLMMLSRITGKPPLWGMALDQTRTFSHGFQCDGSKAEYVLGIVYRPVQESLVDLVHWIRSQH